MAEPTLENERFVTDDGSHSLNSRQFRVPYHSRHGAIQESEHVFIRAGLQAWLANNPDPVVVTILEMGFGTGLNALLTHREASYRPNVEFTYRAVERYPITASVVAALNYPDLLDVPASVLRELHTVPADTRDHELLANFSLALSTNDWLSGLPERWASQQGDVLYYDAFAPASQPALWEKPALQRCYNVLRPGGVFVTYCAQGQFKRDLRSVGFEVDPIPGPPGKREMTRGWKR